MFCGTPASERRISVIVVAVASLVSAGSTAAVGNELYRPDRILIKPRPANGITTMSMASVHSRHNCRVLKTFQSLDGIQVVQLPSNLSVEEAIAEYQASGTVEFAEPDYWVRAFAAPNDPKYTDGTLWALKNDGRNGGTVGADIRAEKAWGIRTSAEDIVVAVIDTGVRYTHEDLAANMWRNPGEIPNNGIDDDANGYVDDVHGINAINDSGDPKDDVGHGTHVAGIIGAVGNNSRGTVGVAWKVKIMACKFMDRTSLGSHSDAAQAIDYARLNGAHIINASWGSGASSSTLRSAITRAHSAGIIFVAAAGNESANDDIVANYPSGYESDNIISVGSSTRSDDLADFSNYGMRTVDLMAPGDAIYSTWHSSDRSYTANSGTSMSTPYVSGALALLRAHFPNEPHTALIRRVFAACDPISGFAEKCVTGGRMNLDRAMTASLLADFKVNRLSGAPPLTIRFTDTSFGEITKRQWDFGDGGSSGDANPTHIFSTPGEFNVTLTVTSADGETHSKRRVVSVVDNYRILKTSYNWIDPSPMTPVSLSDNGVSSSLALPFSFSFYGQSYNRIYIGANGVVGFRDTGLETTSNSDLPNVTAPNAIIAPYWDNLNPARAGNVYYGITGQQPDRRAVISWVNVPRNSTPLVALTFQAVLHEGSNEILFQYLDVQPTATSGGGRRATVGIEDVNGTVAAKHGFNGSPGDLSNRQALLLLPPGSSGLSVSPASGLSMNGKPGGPFYPNSQTYTLENRTTSPIRWSAAKTQDWITLSTASGTVNAGSKAYMTVFVAEPAVHLNPGSYSDTITFSNLDTETELVTRTVRLEIDGTGGVLSIVPDTDLVALGPPGGPFVAATQIYTVLNSGDARLDWTATTTAPWLTLSSTSGTLSAGASSSLTVSINNGAASLPVGRHSEFIFFENKTSGAGNAVREIALEVRPATEPKFSVAQFTSGGQFSFRLTGEPYQRFVIQSSPDLVNWTSFSTNSVNVDGSFEFTSPDAASDTQMFYRVLAP